MARLALIAVFAGALAAGARPADAGGRCRRSIPHLAERQAAAAAWTQKRYEQALARAHLTAVTLVADQLPAGSPAVRGVRPGQAFDLSRGGATPKRAVLVAVGWRFDGAVDFARDQAGTIHQVIRRERVVSSIDYLRCGCDPYGPGGAPPPHLAFVYVLPDGATLGPPVTVAYRARHVTAAYDNKVDGRRPCPPKP